MPLFSYNAKTVSGERISDVIEADNSKSAIKKLQTLGYFPLTVLPHEQDKESNLSLPFSTNRISRKDIVLLTRRLADSLKGGLPLARALGILTNQTENTELARIAREIAVAVQEGKSLSDALQGYPRFFSPMYISMIKAGETAGVLDVILTRLADFQEREEELRYRIQSALAYPVVMLLVGFVSVVFLLTFVIPKFESMFQDMGQAMPLPTRILIASSHIIQTGWWIYLPAIVFIILMVEKWLSTARGRLFLSNLLLRIPVFGSFARKDLISRFMRMLSILLTNGVPILDALNIARNSVANQVFSNDIDAIVENVKGGQGLASAMGHSKLFPPLVSEMISVGEETGNLESSLSRVSGIYEREVEYALRTMTSLLEPVIILFAGVIVCFIALSMLLPVFQISAGLR